MLVNRYYLSRKTRVSISALIQPVGLVVLFSLAFMILLIAQLIIANKLATDGERLTEIALETVLLDQENYLLTNKVLSLGSLDQINIRALSLGLIKISKVEVVSPIPYAYVP
ncbi:MAG: hypothetical protein A3F33_00825 [Candidatus Woykebacteria bacterium RIFCSPHIGHO2_12_FULL_43_10]|uniref:Cell division protein FtsL n=2 Tax=Candidatus Woykeibacteriota TaxID=1817899 RepID=A0A1G1X0J4_9BACT|nr:MAG: hypothetical protein A3F33_00825 [Candidatus Woykebacteria bacterium RIFCSPHIGHO2_12_FULL_43_10]OGY29096.1 MAG: hypothetical protein A3J50_02315 [Candidatus Woykebacteria bacterium RIFCSPHIGHO2_02_FULL_43_16b]OGY32897.1 MAG: hypothetical protein A3A61_02665 [Candidatus Woykebacteria bacterium RIFCSPLOWO2_01_FULL_43_14]